MGFLLEILMRLIIAPFVFAWRRIRAISGAPAGLQPSLADDMRAVQLVETPTFDAVYDRIAQDVIRDARYHLSISQLQAAELLFVSLDRAGATESSDDAVETVIRRIAWRVNSGNLR